MSAISSRAPVSAAAPSASCRRQAVEPSSSPRTAIRQASRLSRAIGNASASNIEDDGNERRVASQHSFMSISSRRAQHVADAADSDEPHRLGRVALDLPAQVLHVGVARTRAPDVRTPPEMLDDLASREGTVGILREQREQAELRGSDLDRTAVHRKRLLREVEPYAADLPGHSHRVAIERAAPE